MYGMVGAALNTVIAFAVLDLLSNIASNKYYKIDYENLKLLKLFIIGILIFLISLYLNGIALLFRVFLKLILIMIFPFIIILTGYFSKRELNSILGAIKKWRNPMNWKFNIENEKSDSTDLNNGKNKEH